MGKSIEIDAALETELEKNIEKAIPSRKKITLRQMIINLYPKIKEKMDSNPELTRRDMYDAIFFEIPNEKKLSLNTFLSYLNEAQNAFEKKLKKSRKRVNTTSFNAPEPAAEQTKEESGNAKRLDVEGQLESDLKGETDRSTQDRGPKNGNSGKSRIEDTMAAMKKYNP